MSGEDVSNLVATQVVDGLAASGSAHLGAIVLHGFLDARPVGEIAGDDDIVRLYADEQFRIWYEIRRGDILHHIPGGSDPLYPKGAVWLMAETPITRGAVGLARVFSDTDTADDDPGGAHGPHYP
jgi:hypothetical protein